MQKESIQTVKIEDLEFEAFISAEKIQARVDFLGQQITKDYQGRKPLVIAILNGSFIFCSDLVRVCKLDCEVQFMKLSSYQGTESTGEIQDEFDSLPDLKGRDVIVVEDIIDKGHTITYIHKKLLALQPNSIAISTLLFKPNAFEYDMKLDYVGFEIPNDFVVGYGLDYNQKGRNLPHIFTLIK